jgi:hypothetical protein
VTVTSCKVISTAGDVEEKQRQAPAMKWHIGLLRMVTSLEVSVSM